MTYTIQQIARVTRARLLQEGNGGVIGHILLDSRKLLFPESSIFFALGGPRRNGNQFIAELYDKGVRYFVVDDGFLPAAAVNFQEAGFLQVGEVLEALQLLCAYHRNEFGIPVIGITGSNGKTIIKEWLYQLLHDDYAIVRSPKSYNSQIGVPLSIWQMNASHTLGIFEAGISQPDEMQKLERMIVPAIGVFSAIGEAHNEGFLSIRQKINEKLKLFVHSKVLIFCADHPDINEAVNTFKNNVRSGDDEFRLFSWSRKMKATVQILSVEKSEGQTLFRVIYQDEEIRFSIAFTDEASVENALTCCCVLLYLGISGDRLSQQMQLLRPVEMRLEMKQGINNCSVINDSYNADINSLTIALDFLQQQQQHSKRTLIMSDILQSGKSSMELYTEVAFILQQKNINRFIGIGPEISRQKEAFRAIEDTSFYSSTAEFKEKFLTRDFQEETVLIKGARFFAFEQISQLLEQKMHQTVLEIDLNAVSHNLKWYQQQLGRNVKLMAMVKAFSYGSGSYEISSLLQFHKVDYLAVAYADEGVELRKAGIRLPIMVMNAAETGFDNIVQYGLEPELFSFGVLRAFEKYLKDSGISSFPVHIKLDTGMRRLGFEQADIFELCKVLRSVSCFKVQTVFSHLAAGGSEAHDGFTRLQATIFQEGCQQLQQALGYPFIRHIANTGAIHRHKELQLDMVRLGIGLYGVDDDPFVQQELTNVTTLKTTISQVKKVRAGDTVGYNRSGVANRDSVIATVQIGYADGYPRMLGNGVGRMWIRGQLAPVMGNVCMDMTMLDITGIPAAEGDEVIVFGQELPVSELAGWAQTIAYEVLTGISQRVKRVYFEE